MSCGVYTEIGIVSRTFVFVGEIFFHGATSCGVSVVCTLSFCLSLFFWTLLTKQAWKKKTRRGGPGHVNPYKNASGGHASPVVGHEDAKGRPFLAALRARSKASRRIEPDGSDPDRSPYRSG